MIQGISGSSSFSFQMQGMNKGSAPPPRPDGEEMFKKLDSDESGGLSAEEFSSIAAKITEKTGKSSEEIFSKFDGDQDGTISFEEMKSARPRGGGRPPRPPVGGVEGLGTSQNFQMFAQAMQQQSGSSLDDILSALENSENEEYNELGEKLQEFFGSGNTIIDAFA